MPQQRNGQGSQQTTDHAEIKQWVESRGGRPATVAGTPKRGEAAGLLRIDFPSGAANPPLEPISWEDFFKKFDEADLAMVYEEQERGGKPSYFCKFVANETVNR